MDGKAQKLREMQNYETKFTQIAGKAIYETMDENWRRKEIVKIMVAEEVDKDMEKKEVSAEEIAKAKAHPKTAMAVVAKLHRQLGHPGRVRLLVALKEASMSEEIIAAAKDYTCDICQSFNQRRHHRYRCWRRTFFTSSGMTRSCVSWQSSTSTLVMR